jgi:hypothetical protein
VRKNPLLFMTLSLALLAGCGQAPGPLSVATPAAAEAEAEALAAKGNSAKVKARFKAFFDKMDINNDKKWTADDFKMKPERFKKEFRGIDTSDDLAVTFSEYWPNERHAELMEDVTARAKVFMLTAGKTRVDFDDVFDSLDAYLKKYLPARERKREGEEAFKDADANNDKYLNKTELTYALGIMESKAFENYIQNKVGRSNGQP